MIGPKAANFTQRQWLSSIVPASSGIPGYTWGMAKVMVSMPDELLARVDAEAARKGSTRSAVLRGFAESALDGNARQALAARRALRAETPGLVAPRGGNVAELVKRGRLR